MRGYIKELKMTTKKLTELGLKTEQKVTVYMRGGPAETTIGDLATMDEEYKRDGAERCYRHVIHQLARKGTAKLFSAHNGSIEYALVK